MSIVFFGSSHHSAKFLELILREGLKPDLVVSAPPKPIGKKQILTENPTVTFAKKANIPYVVSLNNLTLLRPAESAGYGGQAIEPLDHTTVGLMLDFNRIIPNEIIDLFPKGIINIHFSKLPKYRGPAPVQYTILNGDKEAWISYFLINEKVDAGPILAQTSLPLDFTETTETLYRKLIEKSAKVAPQVINDYLTDKNHPRQQTGEPSYTHKLTTEGCQIDWKKSPQEVERLIRVAFPEPGAWTEIKLKVSAFAEASADRQNSKFKVMRLKVLKAHLENEKLVLDIVQLEGKKPVSWKQFMEGHPKVKLSIFNDQFSNL